MSEPLTYHLNCTHPVRGVLERFGFRAAHPSKPSLVSFWVDRVPHAPASLAAARTRAQQPAARLAPFPREVVERMNDKVCLCEHLRLTPLLVDCLPPTFASVNELRQFMQHHAAPAAPLVFLKHRLMEQSMGVELFASWSDLIAFVDANPIYEDSVVQPEIPRPLLIDSRKFTIRAYLLVQGQGPTLHLHDDFLVKIHAHAYDPSTSKRAHAMCRVADKGVGAMQGLDWEGWSECFPRMRAVVEQVAGAFAVGMALTARLAPPGFADQFAVLGVDLLVDEDHGVHFIEFQYNPDMSDTNPVGLRVKRNVVRSLFNALVRPFLARVGVRLEGRDAGGAGAGAQGDKGKEEGSDDDDEGDDDEPPEGSEEWEGRGRFRLLAVPPTATAFPIPPLEWVQGEAATLPKGFPLPHGVACASRRALGDGNGRPVHEFLVVEDGDGLLRTRVSVDEAGAVANALLADARVSGLRGQFNQPLPDHERFLQRKPVGSLSRGDAVTISFGQQGADGAVAAAAVPPLAATVQAVDGATQLAAVEVAAVQDPAWLERLKVLDPAVNTRRVGGYSGVVRGVPLSRLHVECGSWVVGRLDPRPRWEEVTQAQVRDTLHQWLERASAVACGGVVGERQRLALERWLACLVDCMPSATFARACGDDGTVVASVDPVRALVWFGARLE